MTDVIVVGAGSAGCVLAARLSENPDHRVLLVDAGPDYPDRSSTPDEILDGRDLVVAHDWGYVSDQGKPVPRPRLVGGCSATNATFALRGTPADYDSWGKGWEFEDVLPSLRALEADQDFGGQYHNADGPVPIRRYSSTDTTPFHAAFLAAARALGHPSAPDHNAPGAVGAGPVPMNREDGVRMSTALTYLAPARHRPNLEIRAGTQVDDIVLSGGRAIGVRADNTTLHAEQVVLAAGAFGSPLLLLRSGIGPAEQLRSNGVAVHVDLPGVGANLVDHPLWTLEYAAPRPSHPVAAYQSLLTMSTRPPGSGPPSDGQPFDAQIFPSSVVRCGLLRSPTGASFRLGVSAMRPRSRGRVTLACAALEAPPRIEFNHLIETEDLAVMVGAAREARELARTGPFAQFARQELYPGPAVDGAALEAVIRRDVSTYHHASGTCRMGDDRDAVVDRTGQVHGVEGLSVADASILPAIPSANIHLTVLMVAERYSAQAESSS